MRLSTSTYCTGDGAVELTDKSTGSTKASRAELASTAGKSSVAMGGLGGPLELYSCFSAAAAAAARQTVSDSLPSPSLSATPRCALTAKRSRRGTRLMASVLDACCLMAHAHGKEWLVQ